MGIGDGDRLAAAQEWSSRFPSFLPSPPARSRLVAFRARRSMAGRHCCFRCIYLGVSGGYTGTDCETQAVGSGGILITMFQTSQLDCYECAAISKECLFHPYATGLPGFLNLVVRTSRDQMSHNLYLEEAGGTFTCEFLSVATCSLANKDGNASVVGAYCSVIQIGVEINSSHVTVSCGEPWCLFLLVTACGSTWYKAFWPNKGDEIAKCTLAIGFGGNEDADIYKAKLKGESMLKSDAIVIAIAGGLFKSVFKGHLAREKSGLVKFCNMLKVEFVDNFKMPLKKTLKSLKDGMIFPANPGGSSNVRKKTFTNVPRMQQQQLAKKFVKSDCPDDKMFLKVPRVKQSLISSKVDATLGISGSLLHSTKAGIPLLRACWLWIFFLVILLLPSRVNPAEDNPSSEQGNCRYDLTSVATFSCVHQNSAWQPPSKTCCKALLYAIDHVPPSSESGACCLCRYMRAKCRSSKLVTSYVLCKGKDSRTVAKWSSPITTCSTACKKRRRNSSPDMGASVHKDHPVVHGTSNGIFKIVSIAAAAVVLMVLIFLWYFWRFKPAVKSREQHQRLLQEGDRRRQSSARSSTQLKGRRIATSRSSPNS